MNKTNLKILPNPNPNLSLKRQPKLLKLSRRKRSQFSKSISKRKSLLIPVQRVKRNKRATTDLSQFPSRYRCMACRPLLRAPIKVTSASPPLFFIIRGKI